MYLNVSGMPSAVEPFKEMRSLEDVKSERDDIVIQSTKKDFTLYEKATVSYVELRFDSC